MKTYRCRGSDCYTELSENEYRATLKYYSVFQGLCDSCHARVSNAVDAAVEKYESELKSRGNHSSNEIIYKSREFRNKIMGG